MLSITNDLDPRFSVVATEFIRRIQEAGIEIIIVSTIRTPVEQEKKILDGVSWTRHSKHLPQPCCGKSHAIDIAPRDYLPMKLWNPSGELWNVIGKIGTSLGLKWGVWKKDAEGVLRNIDLGHFEWVS